MDKGEIGRTRVTREEKEEARSICEVLGDGTDRYSEWLGWM